MKDVSSIALIANGEPFATISGELRMQWLCAGRLATQL